jgi:hypothetical protein
MQSGLVSSQLVIVWRCCTDPAAITWKDSIHQGRHCSASSWLHQPACDDLEGFRRWLLHLSSPCTQPFANRQLQFTNRIPGCLILDG